MQRLSMAALLGAGLVLLAGAPQAAAPGVFVGPFAFYFESDTCFAFLQQPPGIIVAVLTNAQGIVSGNNVPNSPAVTLVLNPGGYILCENLPGGGFRSYGDGSGAILAS